jgi:esterase
MGTGQSNLAFACCYLLGFELITPAMLRANTDCQTLSHNCGHPPSPPGSGGVWNERSGRVKGKHMTAAPARSLHGQDGATFSYRVTGPTQTGGGPALILLHGLASNQTRWSEFVEHTTLTRTHAVIRVDLRGHGGSVTRRRIGLDLWCDDLVALLDETGQRRALLIGHSLGAQVALHFAARCPQRVLGIGLIDPVFPAALRGRWRLLRLARPLLAAGAAAVRGVNALGLYRRRLPPLDLRELDRRARAALQSREDEKAFVRQYSSASADLRHVPLAVYLQDLAEMFRPPPLPKSLGMPVLVLLSEAGTFADPAQTAALLQGSPNVEVHRIDCHHWPLTERPDEVRSAIEAWCRTANFE